MGKTVTTHLVSDSWNTDKSVCATETSSHAVAQMNCLAKHCFFDFQRLASTVPTP
jgi:hypothetical protein